MTSPKNWLDTMQALEAEATKGPWKPTSREVEIGFLQPGIFETLRGVDGPNGYVSFQGREEAMADAAFIAASREFIPKALECIRELVDVFKRTQFTHVCYPSDICDLCAAGKLIDETLTKWRLG